MAAMNDFETLYDLFQRAGVKFEEGQEMVSFADKTKAPKMMFLLTIPATQTVFSFDHTGKLKLVFLEGEEEFPETS